MVSALLATVLAPPLQSKDMAIVASARVLTYRKKTWTAESAGFGPESQLDDVQYIWAPDYTIARRQVGSRRITYFANEEGTFNGYWGAGDQVFKSDHKAYQGGYTYDDVVEFFQNAKPNSARTDEFEWSPWFATEVVVIRSSSSTETVERKATGKGGLFLPRVDAREFKIDDSGRRAALISVTTIVSMDVQLKPVSEITIPFSAEQMANATPGELGSPTHLSQ